MARAARHNDPLELVGLLWGESAPSARSGISTRSITTLAINLADREGLEAVTIRRLAQEAGVTPMALYPHISGRPQLIELMLDAHAAQLYSDGDLPASRPDWREAVRFVAARNFEAGLARSWTLTVTTLRPVPGPGLVGKYEHELAALDGIGLTDVEMDHALTGILGLAHGAARAQHGLDLARNESGRSDTEWWQQVGPALATAMRSHQFPLAGRVGTAASVAADASADPRAALDYSVDLLVNGLDASTDASRTAPS